MAYTDFQKQLSISILEQRIKEHEENIKFSTNPLTKEIEYGKILEDRELIEILQRGKF